MSSTEPKFLLVFGTRPEAIKMAPVYHVLKRQFDTRVCITAQHREMMDQVLELFRITPDHDLNVMRPNQTLAQVTTRVIEGMTGYLEEERPDYVLVHGDTTTAYAAAIAAFYQRIPVCHVEAGLRTGDFDNPFPEEMNRRQIGSLATHHFAPTLQARENLLRENVPAANVFVTGNTAIDALRMALEMEQVRNAPNRFPADRRGILVTAHRRENFGQPMQDICRMLLDSVEAQPDAHVVFPVHYNPNVRKVVFDLLADHPRIELCDPVDYAEFVALMRDAHLIVTDSGGVQEEAPSLGKPVLVLRKRTERPEAVAAGTVRIVGTVRDEVGAAVSELMTDPARYRDMAQAINPYGDGQAGRRILGYFARIHGVAVADAVTDEFDPGVPLGPGERR